MTSRPGNVTVPELKGANTDRLPPAGQAAASAAVLLPTVILFFLKSLPWLAGWAWSWNSMLRTLWVIATSGAIGAYAVIAIALLSRDAKRRHLAVVVAAAAAVVDLAMAVLENLVFSGPGLGWFSALGTTAVVVTVVGAWGIARRNKPLWMAGLAPTLIAALVLLAATGVSSWYGYWLRYVVVVGLGCAFCWGFDAIASASAAKDLVAGPASGAPPASDTPGTADLVSSSIGQPMTVGAVAPVAQTNSMAIAALVSSLVMSPLGVVFGHISLSQIRRTGEQGKGLAIAGLVIGYLGSALMLFYLIATLVFIGWLKSSIDGFESDIASYTTTTTSPSRTLVGTLDSTASAVKNAEVGDCIHRTQGTSNSDGSRSVEVENVSCSSSRATDRVTEITDDINDCGSRWVRTNAYSPPIVLCLVRE